MDQENFLHNTNSQLIMWLLPCSVAISPQARRARR